jgi:hypothetical protein
VDIHGNWFDTIWGTADWMTPLLELGVKHTRSALGTNPRIATVMQPFFRTGGKHCVILHDTGRNLDKGASQQRLDFLVSTVGAKNIDAIEGPNELNGKMENWAEKLRDYAQWMHRAVKAMPALRHVQIIAPSMIGYKQEVFGALGNLAPFVDRSNVHYYPVGRPMAADFPAALAAARILTPEAPWATEVGYLQAGPSSPLSKWVLTPRAAAKYMTRGWFDLFAAGFERSYVYALLDNVLPSHRNKLFGLMTQPDLRKRPMFHALRNLMRLFDDSGTPPPGNLGYSLRGTSAATKQYLFRRSEGVWLLVLYQDVDSYDRTAFRDIEPPPATITLTLPAAASRVEVFEPTFEATAKQTLARARVIRVPVADHVVVVRITP